MIDDTRASATNSISKNSSNSISKDVSNTIIGGWLLFLYFTVVTICILCLGSYQIQSRMQLMEIGDTHLTIWQLGALSQTYDIEIQELKRQSEIINLDMDRLTAINARVEEFDAQYTPVFDDVYKSAREFKSAYEKENAGFKFEPLKRHGTSTKIIFNDLEGQTDQEKMSDKLKQAYQSLSTKAKRGDDIFRNISSAKKTRKRTEEEIKRKQDDIALKVQEAKKGLHGIIEKDPKYENLEPEDKSRLQDAVLEFRTFTSIFWKIPYSLTLLPTEILVLVLVLAMGVLGSTIFITQLFFRRDKFKDRYDENLNLVFFFSRPLFGAIMALSIFVLAKAGVLFLTDSSAQDGRATLSPFFISFIAIISGLFSEQAIQAIKKAAEKWFDGQSVFADRWGRGLIQAFEKSGRDKTQFAKVIGLDVQTLDAWFEERTPVTPEYQEMLSAWLETPARELFTDIPPQQVDRIVEEASDKTTKSPK